jgi:hypothetical protein
MACRGVHFALTDGELAQILACEDAHERLQMLQEEIEERLFAEAPDRVCETDKAWDAIHRALTDGSLSSGTEDQAASTAILGGRSLYDGEDYIMSLKTPEQVRRIAAHLGSVSEQDLRQGYERIDPADYGGEIGERDFGYTWEWFQGLQDFYRRAAGAGYHVLFTVDQ